MTLNVKMKLSILIPTYNTPCLSLVRDLQRQCEAAGTSHEIIVMDDGSTDHTAITTNKGIDDMPGCRYILLGENIGRARIRNRLVGEARGEWCIITDCDARVTDSNFINRYLSAACHATEETGVIVGGLANPEHQPGPYTSLRYRYEKAAEAKRSLPYRQRHPYADFATFNFMARREVLTAIPFCDDLREYGYEDTLMGIELQRKGIGITHIENSLEHTGIEHNSIFLKKTETALHTLVSHEHILMPLTPLGRTIIRLRRMHLLPIVRMVHHTIGGKLRENLLGLNPSLLAFKIYKLGYAACLL